METWGWLVAYVVGFGLMQLLLYRYFQRDDPAPEATPPVERSSRRSLEQATPRPEEEGIHCQHCGTFNRQEPNVTFCRQCVQPLR